MSLPDQAPDPGASTDPGAAEVSAALAMSIAALAPDGRRLGVAISGGSDSTGLLLAAAAHAAARGLEIEAATVDHRLRAESRAEAEAVAQLCGARGIPHAILTWPHDGAPPGNLAAAAREARRDLLAAWARERRLDAVLLGHTRDDQAETVLLRLARGAGVDGLSGMAARITHDGIPFLRPALDLGRADLRAICRAAGVGWVEDPTNADLRHDRPKARAALAALAPLGLSAEGLVRSAAILADQRAALDHAAQAAAAGLMRLGGAGELRIERAGWRALPRDLRLRLLSAAIRHAAGGLRPRARALDPIEGALHAEDAPPPRMIAGARIEPGPEIAVMREPARAACPVPALPGAVWDGRWRLKTHVRDGFLGPLGPEGLRILRSRAALLPAPPPDWETAPRAAKLTAPALWQGKDLLATPHAGHDPVGLAEEIEDLRSAK